MTLSSFQQDVLRFINRGCAVTRDDLHHYLLGYEDALGGWPNDIYDFLSEHSVEDGKWVKDE